jgi:cytochrome c-type biogenesis protein CcmH
MRPHAALRILAAGLMLCLAPAMSQAVQPDEMLKDPALEHEAREISEGLRCVVCQNQSIDDSDAPLARDLRLLVRERLKAGDSPEQVVDFIVARYGEFVLLKPRLSGKTYLLWLAPLLLLGGGGALAYRLFRRPGPSAAEAPAPLSDEEQRKLQGILDGKTG